MYSVGVTWLRKPQHESAAPNHVPLYLCFLLPMAQDHTKTPIALTGGLFSCSEVDALHLISIAAFTLPLRCFRVMRRKKSRVLLLLPYTYEHV